MTDEEIEKEFEEWFKNRRNTININAFYYSLQQAYIAGRRKGLDEIIRLKQEIRDLRGIEFVPFDERVG